MFAALYSSFSAENRQPEKKRAKNRIEYLTKTTSNKINATNIGIQTLKR